MGGGGTCVYSVSLKEEVHLHEVLELTFTSVFTQGIL